MNTFGTIFRLTTFGESHGEALGGVVDGCPAGVDVDIEFIGREMARRRPGQSKITTSRKETDEVEILSGVFEGKTTGVPIGFIIKNGKQRPEDYDNIKEMYRPSHADYTYDTKYGIRDHRGGGRTSARETVARCFAGALAKLCLAQLGITIRAYTSSVGDIHLPSDYQTDGHCENNPVRCPDDETAARMIELIENVKKEGDTVGGVVTCLVTGVPKGLGAPVFNKLHADLASAMMGINAAKGFEYGMGFEGAKRRGSEVLDRFSAEDGEIHILDNHSGGIQGGISNGKDIYFRVAFKPVATLLREMQTVDRNGNYVMTKVRGRHDPCVVPRAVPIVEAMTAIVLLDHYLLNKTVRL